ncbi:hypothetical protein QOT17_005875 [Balamuthia mandrillaris]
MSTDSYNTPLGPRVLNGSTSVYGTSGSGSASYILPLSAAGDLLMHDGSQHLRLPLGTSGQVLAVNPAGNAVMWVEDEKLTAAGDLLTHDGTSDVILAKGAAGQVLKVASDSSGLEWADESTTADGFSGNFLELNTDKTPDINSGVVAHRDVDSVSPGIASTLSEPSSAGGNWQHLNDAASSSVDDYYIGWYLKMTSGAESGKVALITDYDGIEKIATIANTYPDFTLTTTGDSYLLIPTNATMMWDEMNDEWAFTQASMSTGGSFTESQPINYLPAVMSGLAISDDPAGTHYTFSGTAPSVDRTYTIPDVNDAGTVGIMIADDMVVSYHDGASVTKALNVDHKLTRIGDQVMITWTESILFNGLPTPFARLVSQSALPLEYQPSVNQYFMAQCSHAGFDMYCCIHIQANGLIDFACTYNATTD